MRNSFSQTVSICIGLTFLLAVVVFAVGAPTVALATFGGNNSNGSHEGSYEHNDSHGDSDDDNDDDSEDNSHGDNDSHDDDSDSYGHEDGDNDDDDDDSYEHDGSNDEHEYEDDGHDGDHEDDDNDDSHDGDHNDGDNDNDDEDNDEDDCPVPPPVINCPIPEVTSELSATATVNQLFSYTITATTTGVTATTTTFSVVTSSLPQGLNFSTSTATISGTTTETGTFNITISVANSCGFDSETLVITVNPATTGGGGGGGGNNNPTTTLSANPATITKNSTSTLSWASTNANLCSASWTLATSTSGTLEVAPLSTTDYSITCGNGTASSTATTTITVTDNTGSGGGGGGSSSGGGGGGGGGSSRSSSVAATVVSSLECFYLRDYMRRDFDNDPVEVLKLQAFLINFEGYNNVALTGVFDQATFDAVSAFQVKYFSDILEPWGHTEPTGYVYYLTLKKINEIYCQHIFPLSQSQLNEIVAHRALLENLGVGGGSDEGTIVTPTDTEPASLPPVVGVGEPVQGQVLGGLAAAIFAQPETMLDTVKCLYELILILIILYIIGNVLEDVLYKDIPTNTYKRFLAKWLTMDIGLVAAGVGAYMLGWWCLILPLFIALIIALVWTLTYSKHNSIRASVKSWYLVGSARARTILKETKETPKIPVTPIKEETIKWNIKKESAKLIEDEVIKETEVIILGPEK